MVPPRNTLETLTPYHTRREKLPVYPHRRQGGAQIWLTSFQISPLVAVLVGVRITVPYLYRTVCRIYARPCTSPRTVETTRYIFRGEVLTTATTGYSASALGGYPCTTWTTILANSIHYKSVLQCVATESGSTIYQVTKYRRGGGSLGGPGWSTTGLGP